MSWHNQSRNICVKTHTVKTKGIEFKTRLPITSWAESHSGKKYYPAFTKNKHATTDCSSSRGGPLLYETSAYRQLIMERRSPRSCSRGNSDTASSSTCEEGFTASSQFVTVCLWSPDHFSFEGSYCLLIGGWVRPTWWRSESVRQDVLPEAGNISVDVNIKNTSKLNIYKSKHAPTTRHHIGLIYVPAADNI